MEKQASKQSSDKFEEEKNMNQKLLDDIPYEVLNEIYTFEELK